MRLRFFAAYNAFRFFPLAPSMRLRLITVQCCRRAAALFNEAAKRQRAQLNDWLTYSSMRLFSYNQPGLVIRYYV